MGEVTAVELSTAEVRYLLLYGGTFAVHFLFMNYVLAGTGLVALSTILPGKSALKRRSRLTIALLRDWLPFALSAAITAGVAPLLFVQILYPKQFYSAQLLLSNQWFLVMVALIVGFYLLYLQKTKRVQMASATVQLLVSGTAFLCFLFTAWAWTRNHLLSLHGDQWPEVYASQLYPLLSSAIVIRLSVWCFSSISVMCIGIVWQLSLKRDADPDEIHSEARVLSGLALLGLILTVASGVIFYSMRADSGAPPLHLGYVFISVAATVGLVFQSIAWIGLRMGSTLKRKWIWAAVLSSVLTVLSVTIAREMIRIDAIELASVQSTHATAARSGGYVAFVAVFVINAIAITTCIIMTKRAIQK